MKRSVASGFSHRLTGLRQLFSLSNPRATAATFARTEQMNSFVSIFHSITAPRGRISVFAALRPLISPALRKPGDSSMLLRCRFKLAAGSAFSRTMRKYAQYSVGTFLHLQTTPTSNRFGVTFTTQTFKSNRSGSSRFAT